MVMNRRPDSVWKWSTRSVEGDATRVPLRLFAQRGRNRTHRAGEKRGPGKGKRDTAQQWLG